MVIRIKEMPVMHNLPPQLFLWDVFPKHPPLFHPSPDMGKIGNSNGASSVAFDLGILYKREITDWEVLKQKSR